VRNESIFSFSFLPSVPEINPRTECACQPVSDMISASVAPLARSNSLITLGFLLFRAVCALSFRVARFPDLASSVASQGVETFSRTR